MSYVNHGDTFYTTIIGVRYLSGICVVKSNFNCFAPTKISCSCDLSGSVPSARVRLGLVQFPTLVEQIGACIIKSVPRVPVAMQSFNGFFNYGGVIWITGNCIKTEGWSLFGIVKKMYCYIVLSCAWGRIHFLIYKCTLVWMFFLIVNCMYILLFVYLFYSTSFLICIYFFV